MRARRGSGPAGLAGMAAVVRDGTRPPAAAAARRSRPARLRATLRAAGLAWVEDPSNRDPRFAARPAAAPRWRRPTRRRCAAAGAPARRRRGALREAAIAAASWPARRCFREGFALRLARARSPPTRWPRCCRRSPAGRYPPPPRGRRAGAAPRPATLGGARLLPAGRLGPGWLAAARAGGDRAAGPGRADGAVWDGRFRLRRPRPCLPAQSSARSARMPPGFAARAGAARRRPARRCPRCGGMERVLAVPHLEPCEGACFVAAPPRPAACAAFRPTAPAPCFARSQDRR